MPTLLITTCLDTLGHRLRFCRHAQALSATAFAAAVEITPQYLSTLEHDKALPSMALLQRIAKELGITSSQLLGETPLLTSETSSS